MNLPTFAVVAIKSGHLMAPATWAAMGYPGVKGVSAAHAANTPLSAARRTSPETDRALALQ